MTRDARMPRRRGMATVVALTLLAFVAVLLAANSYVCYVNVRKLIDYSAHVSRARDTIFALDVVQADLTDAETGQRGYLITGEERYREPYDRAAERFGSSIAQALRVQSDSMRVRRRQIAEEKAAKTAVQLIFPLVLFIFPAIFVVLCGPAAIQIQKGLLKDG